MIHFKNIILYLVGCKKQAYDFPIFIVMHVHLQFLNQESESPSPPSKIWAGFMTCSEHINMLEIWCRGVQSWGLKYFYNCCSHLLRTLLWFCHMQCTGKERGHLRYRWIIWMRQLIINRSGITRWLLSQEWPRAGLAENVLSSCWAQHKLLNHKITNKIIII